LVKKRARDRQGLASSPWVFLRSKPLSDGYRGYSLMYRLGFKPWEFDATPWQLCRTGRPAASWPCPDGDGPLWDADEELDVGRNG
jgi:hypothetical protein